jgi:hypothetical protein
MVVSSTAGKSIAATIEAKLPASRTITPIDVECPNDLAWLYRDVPDTTGSFRRDFSNEFIE